MASSGRGISAAVRESISTWITDEVVRQLFEAGGSRVVPNFTAFRRRLTSSESWVRRGRQKIDTGWLRPYACKEVPGDRVGLEVRTNPADTHIRYVTFRVDGVPIGGGVVSVPSTHLSPSIEDHRRIQPVQSVARAQVHSVVRAQVTAAPAPVAAPPAFRPFTPDELAMLRVKHELSDRALESMFEDRG